MFNTNDVLFYKGRDFRRDLHNKFFIVMKTKSEILYWQFYCINTGKIHTFVNLSENWNKL